MICIYFLSVSKNSETVRLRDFSFYLSSTFIYELTSIKIYIYSMHKYFIRMASKVITGHKSSSNFRVDRPNPSPIGWYVDAFLSNLCGYLSIYMYISLSLSILFSLPHSFSYSLSISLSFPPFTLCKH